MTDDIDKIAQTLQEAIFKCYSDKFKQEFSNPKNIGKITIGMLPDVPPATLQFVGNTSIAGAKTSLCSQKAFETAERIAESMTYFDLMGNPDYMDEFIKAKFLPHTDLSLFPSAAATVKNFINQIWQ